MHTQKTQSPVVLANFSWIWGFILECSWYIHYHTIDGNRFSSFLAGVGHSVHFPFSMLIFCTGLVHGGHNLCEFMCALPLLNLENVVWPSLGFRKFLFLLHRFPSLEGRGMAKTCHLRPNGPKSFTVYTLLNSSWFLLTLFGSKFIN